MGGGLLLTLGLTAPAGAAVAGTPAKAGTVKTGAAAAAPTCLTGYANSYEFYTWCKGTSPAASRVLAQCADGDGVIGAESVDNSGAISYANCNSTDSLDSTLGTGNNANWGIVECSNSNGTGTFQGYVDRSGDISGILLAWGGTGGITAGGNLMCQYSNSVSTAISLTTPPT